MESISVVFAGNFNVQYPSQAQLETFRNLYALLDDQYKFERTVGHKHTSPTSCPGKHLEEALADILNPDTTLRMFAVSRYYTPVPGQMQYYRKTYEEDFAVNCHGDCFSPAMSGVDLRKVKPLTVCACPGDDPNTPEKEGYPLGTKFWIDGYGEVTCVDRGGAIKGNRLDIWAGIAEDGLLNMRESTAGIHYGRVIQ